MTPTDGPVLNPVAASPKRLRLSAPQAMAMGMLLVQIAWVFAIPPFRGSDEFDHVYRAASVARGDWGSDPSEATRGTGAWLNVPDDIVAAARVQCLDLPYTGPENCVGTSNGDGTTRIASGAGRYHPFFYALVGWPALPFDGYVALYAMRIAAVLLSWLLFCGAIAATRTWATTAWPYIGLAVAATPVATYSTSVVAPNGVEIFAALMCWSSVIGILRSNTREHGRRLLIFATVSGALLATTRSLGPMWLVLLLATALITAPPSRNRLTTIVKTPLGAACAVLGFLATLQSTLWVTTLGSLNVGEEPDRPMSLTDRVSTVFSDVLLWVFQSIAAFPLRNDASPPAVYGCYLVLFIAFLVVALRSSTGHVRQGLATVTTSAVFVPFLISVATYNSHVSVWQGRYGLPYAVGIAIIAGLALDVSHDPRRFLAVRYRLLGGALLVLAYTISVVDSVIRSEANDPLRDNAVWLHPPIFIIGILVATGAAAVWWSATSTEKLA